MPVVPPQNHHVLYQLQLEQAMVNIKASQVLALTIVSWPFLNLAWYALPYSLLGIPLIMLGFCYYLWRRFSDD